MKSIAVIDDDIYIGNLLEEVLKKENYQVLRAYSGTEAVMLLSQKQPDLVLLDLMLPGLIGEEVLKQVKGIPVIIVSAKSDVCDKVKLLQNGAVDYITKPFDMDELLARISVQFRQNRFEDKKDKLAFADIKMDTDTYEVCVKENIVHLTKTEFAILKLLMQNSKQVITKSILLDKISEDTPDCMESSLKVHISNLRKKLRDAGGRDVIESVWGIGFKLID
ncbi:MAG TPA: response regulator transcription factor [Lachnospiraceae bacterium]|nr:response regulator transcription factor [Lachnospiraceae bacterium]